MHILQKFIPCTKNRLLGAVIKLEIFIPPSHQKGLNSAGLKTQEFFRCSDDPPWFIIQRIKHKSLFCAMIRTVSMDLTSMVSSTTHLLRDCPSNSGTSLRYVGDGISFVFRLIPGPGECHCRRRRPGGIRCSSVKRRNPELVVNTNTNTNTNTKRLFSRGHR